MVSGILPLVHMRSRLFGNALVSLPFAVYGGIVADSETAHAALAQHACALAHELGVDYLEMRNRRPRHPQWPTKSLYVTFRKAISADTESNYNAIPRKQRAMIRKGMDAGLESKADDGLEHFYRLYSESVHNLGTPVFSKKYFALLQRVFGDACAAWTVWNGAQPVSSVLSFYFRDEVLPYYGGGGNAARDLKANDFMYWELMRQAGERGVRTFDYGRSKQDSGSYRFKKHWGFEPEPLFYEYYLVKAKTLPNVSPTNPKYRHFITAWKRLPLPVTRVLGPLLARSLG